MAKQSGFMMLVIALLLVVIAGFAAAFVAMLMSGTNAATSTMSLNNAYDLAQTGIEEGSYQLTLDNCDTAWSATTNLPGVGEYQYNCTQNIGSTTTTAALTVSATTVPLNAVTTFANFGAVTIDSEIIYYDGISGKTLLNARRGQNGTTAATHVSGATAIQSQYIISSQAGAPTLTSANGRETLSQAVLLANNLPYYAAGTNGSKATILYYNGNTWTTALSGVTGVILYGIEISASYGQAVGYNTANQSYQYTFNGTTWTQSLGPIANMNFQDVSCDLPSNPTICWIVGQNKSPTRAMVYRAGVTYNSLNNYLLSSVSCTNGTCYAVGAQFAMNFASGSILPFLAENGTFSTQLTDVDCAQANSCVATQNGGKLYYFNGLTTNVFQITTTALNAVSCPSSTSCIVVGAGGKIYNCTMPITAVSSCVTQTSPGTLNLLDVHCNATNNCIAVGAGTLAYHYTGGFWTTKTLPASHTLNAITGVATSTPSGGVTPTVWHNQ